MVTCEYCGEEKAIFSIKVITTDGNFENSDLVCAGCVGIWFTETPEDVERMSVARLREGKD